MRISLTIFGDDKVVQGPISLFMVAGDSLIWLFPNRHYLKIHRNYLKRICLHQSCMLTYEVF